MIWDHLRNTNCLCEIHYMCHSPNVPQYNLPPFSLHVSVFITLASMGAYGHQYSWSSALVLYSSKDYVHTSYDSFYKWTKILSLEIIILSLKMMVKSGLESILKLTEPLQSCCCPVQKYLPRMAELARQLSRYLWRGSVNFKINSRPLFTITFKLKNDNFKTRDFSPHNERVLAGVKWNKFGPYLVMVMRVELFPQQLLIDQLCFLSPLE